MRAVIAATYGAVVCSVGEGSVVSFSAFWVTVLALGATVLTAWGGYGKNSQVGLSLKRVGPLPAVKVCTCIFHVLLCTAIGLTAM